MLSPGALGQRCHGIDAIWCLDGNNFALITLHLLNLIFVQNQVILHVAGQVVHADIALVAIGQHLLGAVVTGNDDPATTLDVEYVESIALYTRGLGMSEFDVVKRGGRKHVGGFLLQKLVGG